MSRYIHLFIFALLMLYAIGCSEVYYPKVKSNTDFLVVDGLITNTNGPFVIKLSKAVKYNTDSVIVPAMVSKATLKIADNNNITYSLTETTPGNYTTPSSFVPVIGNSYKLYIKTAEGDAYESDFQKMIPPVSCDSLKVYETTEKFLDSKKTLQTTIGGDIRVDLSNASPAEKIRCRFTTNLTAQYMYTAPPLSNLCIAYKCFGWITGLTLENNINITDQINSGSNDRIVNHKIGFVPYTLPPYQAEGKLSFVSKIATLYYYLKINQYTLNETSFAFYQAAKGQFGASGKIFDPITTQLYSNIKCTTDPSKLALGFFEASSVTTNALFIFEQNQKMVSVKVPSVDIQASKLYEDPIWICASPPSFLPVFTAYPSWWGHGIL